MCKETSKELSGNKSQGSGSAGWARLNVNVELAKHNTVEMSVKLATVQGRNIKVPQLLKAGEDQAGSNRRKIGQKGQVANCA